MSVQNCNRVVSNNRIIRTRKRGEKRGRKPTGFDYQLTLYLTFKNFSQLKRVANSLDISRSVLMNNIIGQLITGEINYKPKEESNEESRKENCEEVS